MAAGRFLGENKRWGDADKSWGENEKSPRKKRLDISYLPNVTNQAEGKLSYVQFVPKHVEEILIEAIAAVDPSNNKCLEESHPE